MKRALITAFFVGALSLAIAQTPEELAKQSEEKAAATAADKSTPQIVIDKVNAAAAVLEKEGVAAIAKFRGKDSDFIFSGTYMSIHAIDGEVLLNPIKPKMEGQNLLNLKDADGKAIFVEMNEVAQAKGAGWISYKWPQPGAPAPVLKVTYFRLVKIDGRDCVLKCGIYGLSEEEIAKLTGE